MKQALFWWALVLAFGFPCASLLLSEASELLSKHGSPFASFFNHIRILVLPPLALLLVMQYLLDVSPSTVTIQAVKTVTWIAMGYACLSLLNSAFKNGSLTVTNLVFQSIRGLIILLLATYLLDAVWQFDLAKVVTALGVGSLVIALALQDTLSNLVSGFLLILESPLKVGDWVRVRNFEGEVIEINWRAVRLMNRDKDIIIIPNGVLGKEIINNYTITNPTHSDRVVVHFSLDDPPNRVKPVLEEAALMTHGVLSTPLPEIRTRAYENYSIQYEVKYCIANTGLIDLERIRADLMTQIYYTAKRHGLTMPFPTTVEYKLDGSQLKRTDPQQTILQVLRESPYFATLEPDAIERLAQASHLYVYGVGEQLVKVGEPAKLFYLIVSGGVMLSAPDIAGHDREVIRLGKGEFFGETVLLRGETNPVSVTVTDDLTAITITPAALMDTSQRHPKFTLTMTRFLEKRREAVSRLSAAVGLSSPA